jgi:hypothetical protein
MVQKPIDTRPINTSGNLTVSPNFPHIWNRNIPVDRNNIAPRWGFAYTRPNTVVRGGAGIY